MRLDDAIEPLGEGEHAAVNDSVRKSLPSLPTYLLALTVFLSGLAVWWWAERGLEL
jgi:hypothetical protein